MKGISHFLLEEKIKVPFFCFECESEQCNNLNHRKIQLHPILRIPKKRASKKKWKEFYEVMYQVMNKEYINLIRYGEK